MDKTFKIIVYIFAALILSTTPSLSAFAAEESTQPIETPSENTPAESTPVQNPLEESQPAPGETPEQTPADTTQHTQTLPESAPATSQNISNVTPMQDTVYAATQNGLNVRSGPSTSHSKIGTLKYGQAVTVTGKTADNWYQIQYEGSTGYVLADYVSSKPLTNTENENPAADNSIVDYSDSESAGDETSSEIVEDEVNSESQTEDVSYVENNFEVTSSLLGTPVVVGLVTAILIVLALIGYSIYSLFKKENDSDEEYYEEEPYTEDAYYDNEQYADNEYYDNEQYADDEYYEDEYYEEEQYSEDEYYEEEQYPEDEQYPDDKPRQTE